jgi:hypothetical protein
VEDGEMKSVATRSAMHSRDNGTLGIHSRTENVEAHGLAEVFTFSGFGTLVPLHNLPCSEPVAEKDFDCSPKLELSQEHTTVDSSSEFDVSEPVGKGNLFSSPIHTGVNNVDDGPNKVMSLSPIFDTTFDESIQEIEKLIGEADDNNDEFLQFIEQSFHVQEEIISGVIAMEQSDQFIESSRKALSVAMESVPDHNVPELPPVITEHNFSGFGENTSSHTASAKLEALRLLQHQLSHTRKSVIEYRLGNNDFIRQMWRNRYMCSGSQAELGSSIDEMSDIVTALPNRLTYTPTPCRVTRSRGPVEDYPNVQGKTLEYKTHGEK